MTEFKKPTCFLEVDISKGVLFSNVDILNTEMLVMSYQCEFGTVVTH